MTAVLTEDAKARLERAIESLSETALAVKDERNRYGAALRRIASWQKYHAWEHSSLTEYEGGANDAIDTLATIASDALHPSGDLFDEEDEE